MNVYSFIYYRFYIIIIKDHFKYCLIFFFFRDLKMLQERQHKKCERLEIICQEEENCHFQKITQLQDRNRVINTFYIDQFFIQ